MKTTFKTPSWIIPLTILALFYLSYRVPCSLSFRYHAETPMRPFGDTLTSDVQVALSSNASIPSKTTCLEPRIRKEWRALTLVERENWIKSVKCFANLPSANSIDPGPFIIRQPFPYNKSATLYDDFSYVHEALRDHIHQTGLFFPWHRYFLWHFERTLVQQCNYTGSTPYWNWTLDTDDFEHSYLLNNSDPDTGFGNFGDDVHQQAVVDGAFANFRLAYPYPHFLRRQFFPYPWFDLQPPWYHNPTLKATDVITLAEINKTITGFRNDFRGFQTYFERMQGPHLSIHFALGGDMGGYCIVGTPSCVDVTLRDPGTSPNDPLFWLHHGMIDKIWHDWQNMYDENMHAFGGGSKRDLATWPKYPVGAPPDLTPDSILPSIGLLVGNFTVKDMFNTMSSFLCYTYE